MNERTVAQTRRSKFSGALFRARGVNNISIIIRAFILQALVLFFASIIVALPHLPSGDSPSEYLFSLRSYIRAMQFVLVIWSTVWILSHIDAKFLARFFPASLVTEGIINEDVPTSIIQDAFDKEVSYTDDEARLSNKLRVISDIDERISRLRVQTNYMLYVTGLLLIGASLIIVFAGTLTNLDASAVSNVDKISKDISDAERDLDRLSQIQELKKASLTDPGAAKQLSNLNLTSFGYSLPLSDEGIKSSIAAKQQRLAQSEKLLQDAWEKELSSERGYNDTRYIIATAIIRIGVVLVIIFLAQILIGLYRYNTRLITFYNSRRDLFQIWNGKGADIEQLQKLTAPNIDFGKEPKHPLEDVIKQVLAKVHFAGVSVGETNDKESKKT